MCVKLGYPATFELFPSTVGIFYVKSYTTYPSHSMLSGLNVRGSTRFGLNFASTISFIILFSRI
jgi:hypothetical protein